MGVYMEPKEQKTSTVIEKIYSQLIITKAKKCTINYSECFTQCFNMKYTNKYCHITQERSGVINNIPYILGAIGQVCNDLKLPPLSCLVVNKSTGKCGKGVVVSKEGVINPIEFAEKIDRPAIYLCDNYPQPGSQQGKNFLNLVIDRIRKNKHNIINQG
jgi:hypothetical protein